MHVRNMLNKLRTGMEYNLYIVLFHKLKKNLKYNTKKFNFFNLVQKKLFNLLENINFHQLFFFNLKIFRKYTFSKPSI